MKEAAKSKKGPLYKAKGTYGMGYSIPNPFVSEAELLKLYDMMSMLPGTPGTVLPSYEEFKKQRGLRFNKGGQVTPTNMLFNKITNLFAEANALEQQGEVDLAFNKRDEAGRLQEQYETIRAGMSRLGPESVSNPINADDNIIMQGIKGLFNIPDYISAAKNRSENAAALMNEDPIAMRKYGGIADVERQKNPLEM